MTGCLTCQYNTTHNESLILNAVQIKRTRFVKETHPLWDLPYCRENPHHHRLPWEKHDWMLLIDSNTAPTAHSPYEKRLATNSERIKLHSRQWNVKLTDCSDESSTCPVSWDWCTFGVLCSRRAPQLLFLLERSCCCQTRSAVTRTLSAGAAAATRD